MPIIALFYWQVKIFNYNIEKLQYIIFSGGIIEMTVNEQIGKRIKELRKEKGLTQTEFGQIFNMKQNAVTNIETGKQTIYFEDLLSIANYFGVTTDYLIKENAVKEENPNLQYICDYTGLNPSTVNFLNNTLNVADNEFLTLYTRLTISKQQYKFFLKIIEKTLMSKKVIRTFREYYNSLFQYLIETDKTSAYYQEEICDIGLYRISKAITNIIENYGTELFKAEFLELEEALLNDKYETIEEAHKEGLFNE